MKTLNERATEILKALLAVRAKKLKIKNASQTIHVKLTDCIGKYNLISLTQHIEINGVLFRDPEVIFASTSLNGSLSLTTTSTIFLKSRNVAPHRR